MSQSVETPHEPLKPEAFAALATAVALTAYLGALISQYGFGWKPCELCLWQRVPYLVGFALALPALLWSGAPRRLLYIGAAAVFLIGAGLALYHTLVEFGVLEGLASCGAATISAAPTFEAFAAETAGETPVVCGARTPFFLGLTMTNWNLLVSLDIAALFALAAFRR